MITPILKDPRPHGGTLYTFPSASRDLTRAFTNSDYEFAFSHFACLNLPDFRYGNFEDGDLKGIYLDNLCKYYYSNSDSDMIADSDSDSDSLSDTVSNNLNTYLKWHLQSYIMNYEVAILNGFSLDSGKYDNEILRTPSERIFFNWLQKVGAIKFSGNAETINGYGNDIDPNLTVDESLYSEEELGNLSVEDRTKIYKIGNKLYKWKGGQWRSRLIISKTVQYIGTIDMINNVNIDEDSFNEIYLNIPSGVGGSDVKFYFNVFDNNYEKGEIIDVKKDMYCHSEDEDRRYIIGRSPLDFQNDTLLAIYDSEFDFDDINNEYRFASPTYKIDNGYCINFNDDVYSDNDGGVGIESMNLGSEENFEFNCVLIYYRIRKGNGEWYTNLYGVLFLEEVTISDYNTSLNDDDERGGYIQRYPKFKNGNSWGLKLDLKIDAQPDSQMELRDKLYDDPNEGGAGMQMFAEALIHLNDCTKIFYEVKEENTAIEERLYKLENIVTGVDTVYDLRDEVGVLRTNVEIFQPELESLGRRVEDIEGETETLASRLGYLISNIQSSNNEMKDRISKLESNIDKLNSYIKDLLVIEQNDSKK